MTKHTVSAAATGLPRSKAVRANSGLMFPKPTGKQRNCRKLERIRRTEERGARLILEELLNHIAPTHFGIGSVRIEGDLPHALVERLLSLPLQSREDAATLLRLVQDEALTDAGDRIAYTKLIRFLQDPAPLASPLSLATVADQPMSEHPDAALLDAWASFKMGHEDLAAIGGDADEIYDRIDAARLVLDSTQAKTIQGAAVRLSYVFADRYEWLTAFHAMFYGTDIPAEHLPDERDVVFFDVTKNVRALALVSGGQSFDFPSKI